MGENSKLGGPDPHLPCAEHAKPRDNDPQMTIIQGLLHVVWTRGIIRPSRVGHKTAIFHCVAQLEATRWKSAMDYDFFLQATEFTTASTIQVVAVVLYY